MSLLLFMLTLVVSFIAVRIGAVAFQLTGLEWSLAKFQALSCFTGTGFTTKEAELIAGYPQRRQIASVLMIFGNAGLVTLVATFGNFLQSDILASKVFVPFVTIGGAQSLVPWINLIVMIIIIYLGHKFFTHSKFGVKFTDFLRARVAKKNKPVSFEELVILTGGYGISYIDVSGESMLLNKTILNSGLKRQGILVLAIERKEEIIPNPAADTQLLLGDSLICFGKSDNIRNAAAEPEPHDTKKNVY
ncbi:MAG: TrkA C-terminal domain-containing protein [Candidatus Omnitrophota bacterium]